MMKVSILRRKKTRSKGRIECDGKKVDEKSRSQTLVHSKVAEDLMDNLSSRDGKW